MTGRGAGAAFYDLGIEKTLLLVVIIQPRPSRLFFFGMNIFVATRAIMHFGHVRLLAGNRMCYYEWILL